MKEAAGRLARILGATPLRLAGLSDAEAAAPLADGHWSRKEILGHLIDSAAHNHQRFVRAQLAPRFEGSDYEQERWVAAQGYAAESWPDLVNLWLLYNRHLLHIIGRLPAESLATLCVIEGAPAVPLSQVVTGYLDHLEHHLSQILG